MNRRDFLFWSIRCLAAAGLGRYTTGCSTVKQPVTVLSVPDLAKNYAREFARIMAADQLDLGGKRVLLKPNFVEFHRGHPINTDVRLLSQVAEACFIRGAKQVVIGEAAGHRRDPWYSMHNPLLRESLDKKVQCLDLNHGPAVRMRNKGPHSGIMDLFVAEPVANADVVISMPKMKTHHWVGVTLSLKNLFGTLPGIFYGWPKNPLHFRGIENSIIDISLTVPVHYAIIDGVIGMEGDGPIMGTAKKVGAVVMARNLLAADSTAARIMGFNPKRIPYLVMAGTHLPGIKESSIAQRGEAPDRFATRFSCLPQFESFR